MPSPRKYHPHGSVLFVTLSLEEGLLLRENPLCEKIIQACLADAQARHPLCICHHVVEGSHLHLLVVVENPDDVPGFIGRFKTESAHMFNRLLGRRKRTVWCEGYDSPVVLTPARALACIAYLYANPAKDNLVDSIDEYPGLSSWAMFRTGRHTRQWRRFHRPAVRFLPPDAHCLPGYSREAERLLSETRKVLPFTIRPNAWMEAFGIADPSEQEALNAKLIRCIRTREERARRLRARKKKTVVGAARLRARPIDMYYRPERSGRRMWCLADRRAVRVPFIRALKRLIASAKRIYRKWFVGDFSESYPLGLYPPRLPKLAEPIGAW